MPPDKRALSVPEDVVHLIFHEIISQRDRAAFHTAALLDSSFLYVAHFHLFRSCSFYIEDSTSVHDIITLLDIIDKRPYISTLIKELNIVDIPHTAKKPLRHRYKVPKDNTNIPPQAYDYHPYSHQNTLDIFTQNAHNLLPRLRRVLPSLSTLNLSFQPNRLDWHALHEDVKAALQGLFSLPRLGAASLSGVVNIPTTLSNNIFTLPEIELNNCHFASSLQLVPLGIRKAKNSPTRRREVQQLRMELGQVRSNFEHVVLEWHRQQHWQQFSIPQVHLSINGLHGPWDAAVVLATLGSGMKELSLSTTELQLGFMQHQPPRNPFIYPSVRLPRIHSHSIGECFATDECTSSSPSTIDGTNTSTTLLQQQQLPDNHPSSSIITQLDHPSWFLHLMSPLLPRFHHPRSFSELTKLAFQISHWRSAQRTETNGELLWLIHWLAELPHETASAISHLSIVVHVGTDYCLDSAGAVAELAAYEGWAALDLVVGRVESWGGLEKVDVRVRARTGCVCAKVVEEGFGVLLGWMRERMLPVLHARKVVDVSFESMD